MARGIKSRSSRRRRQVVILLFVLAVIATTWRGLVFPLMICWQGAATRLSRRSVLVPTGARARRRIGHFGATERWPPLRRELLQQMNPSERVDCFFYGNAEGVAAGLPSA